MIMADENGANKRAVGNVLGEDMRQRTVSCQWHFLRCVKKVLHRIDVQDHDDFMKLCNLLVKNVVTKMLMKSTTLSWRQSVFATM